jgi:hypothetical protein
MIGTESCDEDLMHLAILILRERGSTLQYMKVA